MRVQSFFSETRTAVLHELMREHPFATLVAQRDGSIDATHLPLVLVDEGEYGTLHGHAARVVDFQSLAGSEVLVIFQAAHAYVSPSWYASKQVTGQVVPTWNYAVVHAYGELRVIDDAAWIGTHLEAMTHIHEHTRTEPWSVGDAPAEYTSKLIASLVGIEIRIQRLLGKFKLSQNRSLQDRLGVLAGLRAEPSPSAHEVARMMEQG